MYSGRRKSNENLQYKLNSEKIENLYQFLGKITEKERL